MRSIAFEDYKKGASLSEIAVKRNVSLNTVKSWHRRYWKDAITQDAPKMHPKVQKGAKKGATDAPAKKSVKTGIGGNGNLIPLNQRTKEEQREIQSSGGIASGIARREKSAAKAIALMVLSGSIPTSDNKTGAMREMLVEMGIPAAELNMQAAMIGGQVLSGMRGNHHAAQLVLGLVGEDPTVATNTDDELVDEYLEGVLNE